MKIVPLKELAKGAFVELNKYQTGVFKPLATGRPYIDNLFGGMLPGDVATIAAGSGVGKSHELQRIIENVLDVNLNPDAAEFVSLNVSLEMKLFSLVLRGLHAKMSKSKRRILLEQFTDEEKAIAQMYFDSLNDERQYIAQEPTTPKEFYEATREFCIKHKNKKAILISADHVVLFGSDKGGGKQEVVESLLEYINDLKMEFSNVYFIILSQLNSLYLTRAKDNDLMSKPSSQDLYYSQFTFQVSSYVCVIANPHRTGINEYMKFIPERYAYLSQHYTEERVGKVSFVTFGKMFYHLLKCREEGVLFDDIFIEDITIPNKEKFIEKKYTSTNTDFNNFE